MPEQLRFAEHEPDDFEMFELKTRVVLADGGCNRPGRTACHGSRGHGGSCFSPGGTISSSDRRKRKTGLDLYLLTFAGAIDRDTAAAVRPLVATPVQEQNAEVSPDGAWLAYQSDESGTYEVYVRSPRLLRSWSSSRTSSRS